jgi:hypothetical protein
MSDPSRDPNLPRPFRGQAQLDRPIAEHGPVAPWHATVKVVPIHLQRVTRFQVIAEWTGPPAAYMPADDQDGARQDIYLCDEPELAKAVAGNAVEQLGRGQVPDLREVAQHLRARLAAGPYG